MLRLRSILLRPRAYSEYEAVTRQYSSYAWYAWCMKAVMMIYLLRVFHRTTLHFLVLLGSSQQSAVRSRTWRTLNNASVTHRSSAACHYITVLLGSYSVLPYYVNINNSHYWLSTHNNKYSEYSASSSRRTYEYFGTWHTRDQTIRQQTIDERTLSSDLKASRIENRESKQTGDRQRPGTDARLIQYVYFPGRPSPANRNSKQHNT
jgi:hypothetical protein